MLLSVSKTFIFHAGNTTKDLILIGIDQRHRDLTDINILHAFLYSCRTREACSCLT